MQPYMQILKEWKRECHLHKKEPLMVNYVYDEDMIIYTKHPGALIGKGGEKYRKYLELLQANYPRLKRIKFTEIFEYIY